MRRYSLHANAFISKPVGSGTSPRWSAGSAGTPLPGHLGSGQPQATPPAPAASASSGPLHRSAGQLRGGLQVRTRHAQAAPS
jgi:hypothetical protein